MLKNNRCDRINFVYDCTFINIHLTSGKIYQDSYKDGKVNEPHVLQKTIPIILPHYKNTCCKCNKE